MLAGAVTGLCIAFIETPIDLVKTKLQTVIIRNRLNPSEKPLYTGVKDCVNHIYSRYGIRGIYQGLPATVIRNVPANALFFPVSELLQRRFADQAGILPSQIPLQQRLIAGACAGLCYWVGTYPSMPSKANACLPALTSDRAGWALRGLCMPVEA